MRSIELEMTGPSIDRIFVDLAGRPRVTARMGFEEVTRELTSGEAGDLLGALDGLSLPVLPRAGPQGLDGTTYRLRLVSGFVTAEFGWWEEVPKSWAPLEGIVQRLVKLTGRRPGYSDTR
jgi:hypothetical protein